MGIHCARCGITIEGTGYWTAVYDVTIKGDTWLMTSGMRTLGIFYCKECLKVAEEVPEE